MLLYFLTAVALAGAVLGTIFKPQAVLIASLIAILASVAFGFVQYQHPLNAIFLLAGTLLVLQSGYLAGAMFMWRWTRGERDALSARAVEHHNGGNRPEQDHHVEPE